ncbi:outer membrane beta-barrel family protein [Flavobacterium sp. MC2016-06]|uniref:outer membrane beta-barrel family protein n=1 Tax=Flavobacterium sp. MC2016-06 TaxID=2676308 RepID=UPI0012BAA9C7|nr:outer membrane beta-barrel family protein [Flavobacterium sp. MC2016-06]MBU3860265.1 outer membrane beta-barrel family protein [Flavobacterium sp. MC2016-06]
MKVYFLLKIIIIILLFCFSLAGYSQVEIKKDSISNELNEVVIANNKKAFSYQNGNIKMDVANSIYNSIPNTLDLLSKLPTVLISADKETVSVVGKGNALIYIDNQKVGIEDLNALAAADIKSIEIIKNPSSKYEAQGRVVILITRKFSKKEGSKTNVSETASLKKDFNNYFGLNSSFKKNKLEWKANFNYNQLQPWESHRINYQIPDAAIISNYNVAAFTKRTEFVYGAGLFYKMNEDDYLSFNFSGKSRQGSFTINTETYNKKEDEENNVITLSDNNSRRNFVNSFVNYFKKIKSINTQMFTGFQYSRFDQKEQSLAENNFNNTQFDWAQESSQKFKVDVFSGRIDLEKKFKNEMKLEFGGLYLSAKAKTDFETSNFETDVTAISKYKLDEKNSAVYTRLSGTLKKIEFSAGLRLENTNVLGKLESDNQPLVHKNYTNLFPKLELNYPIDTTKSISINYAKSIDRPNYSSTSQGATYINPYFIYSRNINLNPTFTDEIATSFQYKEKSVRLSYFKSSDPVYSSFSFDNQNNVLTFKEVNYRKESGFNLDFTLPFEYKLWTTTNSLTFAMSKIEDITAQSGKATPYLYYYTNNTFRLPKGYTIVTTVWGLTDHREGVFLREGKCVVDLAISRTYFKNWDLTLSCNDIFKGTIYGESFTVNNISSRSRYLVDTHEISLALKYSFGKIKDSQFKEKDINENSDRIK